MSSKSDEIHPPGGFVRMIASRFCVVNYKKADIIVHSLKSACDEKYIFHRAICRGHDRGARRESDATAAAGGPRFSNNNYITARYLDDSSLV